MGTVSRGGIFDDTNAINAAVFAATNSFCEPVVQVEVLWNGVWYRAGGGSVLAPNLLVCTSHQVATTSDGSFVGVRVIVRNNIDNSIIAEAYADWWFVHPSYLDVAGQGRDAAIVHLTNAIPVIPITRFRGQDTIGTPVLAVGYGKVGAAGSSDTLVYDGHKRVGTNTVVSIGYFSIDSNYLVTQFTPGTWQAAVNDSGGALLVETNGEMQLAGILACVSPAGGRNYGNVTGATRISLINDWIDRVIASLSPTLNILQVDRSTATLSWPSPAPGFVLQQTTNLTDWTNSVAPVSDDGTNKHATFTTSGAQTFWRLIAQPVSGQISTMRQGVVKPVSDLNATNRDVGDLLPLVREPEE